AYREARARIDRLEGPPELQQAGLSHGDILTEAAADIEALGNIKGALTETGISTEETQETEVTEESKDDPLAAEFSASPKLLNQTYRGANEQANHRREPRRRSLHMRHRR